LAHNKIDHIAPDAFNNLVPSSTVMLAGNPLAHVDVGDLAYLLENNVGLDVADLFLWRKVARLESRLNGAQDADDLPVNKVTASWGDAQYTMCEQPYSFHELLKGYKDSTIRYKTGGLGKLIDEEHEVWVCLKDHPCADEGGWFCFVYNELTHIFIPWATNKILQLVRPEGGSMQEKELLEQRLQALESLVQSLLADTEGST
jgi:hypothetical protein